MTPAIQAAMQIFIEAGGDPTLAHWFDISDAPDPPDYDSDIAHRPPFNNCVVACQSHNLTYAIIVKGENPEKGIKVTVFNCETADGFKSLEYVTVNGHLAFRPLHDTTLTQQEAKTILNAVFNWYRLLSQGRLPTHQPHARPTILNQRRIATGKPPKYEWKTVYLEPVKPRFEPKGGTHASPRLHDRRGHLRRLRNGRSVWVKPCKVGDASKGAVWHDYAVRR
jgi:hypothetical protein